MHAYTEARIVVGTSVCVCVCVCVCPSKDFLLIRNSDDHQT